MTKRPVPDLLSGIVEVRRMCLYSAGMVPVVVGSTAWAGNVRSVPAPKPGISVSDFVFGYLALGLHQVPIQTGDFGTAICVDYAPLPSRWADRMLALHRAFVRRFDEVGEFFRVTHPDLGLALAEVEDAEPIRRFGTPRKALLALTLVPSMRRGSTDAEIREQALFAEPKATADEIDEAATAALSYAASEQREATQ